MKTLLIDSKLLHASIKKLKMILPSTQPTLPSLDFIRAEVKNGAYLTLSATNLEIYFKNAEINVTTNTMESYSFLIPKSIMKVLKNIPHQSISLIYDSEIPALKLKCNRSEFNFKTLNVDQYPNMDELNASGYKTLFTAERAGEKVHPVIDQLKKLIPFLGVDDLRLNLCGVYLETLQDNITLTATNANILRTVSLTQDIEAVDSYSLIIPAPAAKLLAKTNPSFIDFKIEEQERKQYCMVQTLDYTMVFRKTDEKYPDYRNVLPKEHSTIANVDRKELLNQLKVAKICANSSTMQGVFKFAEGKIDIKANDWDTDSSYTGAADCTLIGDNLVIGFNLNYFETALNGLSSNDNITIELGTANQAAIITEPDVESKTLLMPVLLDILDEQF